MVSTKNRLFWLIPVAAVLIAVIAGFILLGGGTNKKWQEQYDLGIRYLTDMNYEAALAAFTAAIEIDPNQASAYVSRAQAHAAAGDPDSARADFTQAIAQNENTAAAYAGLLGLADTVQHFLDPALPGWLAQLHRLAPDQVTLEETEYERIYNLYGTPSYTYFFDPASGRLHSVWIFYDETLQGIEYSFRLEEGTLTGYTVHEYTSIPVTQNGESFYATVTDRFAEYDTAGSLVSYYLYDYDEAYRQVRSRWYDADGTPKEFTEMDEDGHRARTYHYDYKGDLFRIYVFERDDQGRITRQLTYLPDNTLEDTHTYTLDADGNVVREIRRDGSGNLIYDRQYDTDGNLIG